MLNSDGGGGSCGVRRKDTTLAWKCFPRVMGLYDASMRNRLSTQTMMGLPRIDLTRAAAAMAACLLISLPVRLRTPWTPRAFSAVCTMWGT